jgi:hypothetical protein
MLGFPLTTITNFVVHCNNHLAGIAMSGTRLRESASRIKDGMVRKGISGFGFGAQFHDHGGSVWNGWPVELRKAVAQILQFAGATRQGA